MLIRFFFILLLFPITHFGQYCSDFNFELKDDALTGARSVHRDQNGLDLLYITNGTGYMRIIDCSDPENLVYLGHIALFNWWTDYEYEVNTITQRGEYIYLAFGDIYPPYEKAAGILIIETNEDPMSGYIRDVWLLADETSGGASSVSIKDDLAYLCTSGNGLVLIDISDPTSIDSITSFLPEPNFPEGVDSEKVNAKHIILEDSRAYLANGAGGIRILDISNPLSINEIGQYSNPALEGITHNYLNLVKQDNYLYATTGTCGLEVLDVSDVENITLVHWWNPWDCEETEPIMSDGYLNEIELNADCNYIFVSAGRSEFYAFNIFNRAAPALCEHYGATDNGQTTYGLSIYEDQVYLGYVPEDEELPVYGGVPSVKGFTYNVACGIGIEEIESINKTTIYPNPAHGLLNISFFEETTIEEVVIYDLLGKIVFHDQSGESTLSIADLEEGVYLIHLLVDGKELVDKLIVE